KIVFIQVASVLTTLILVSVGGYYWQQRALSSQQLPGISNSVTGASSGTSSPADASVSKLGDLSTFNIIAQDMLGFVNAGDMSGATTRANDLEYEWDNAQARLQPRDPAK